MAGPRIGSLCSGYRGLDAAVEAVFGGTTAWVSDIDPGANKILAHHWPDVPNHGDLTTTDWSLVEPVDIVCGGYPCQPFSNAGKRKGIADERHIWPWIARALGVLRPRLAVFENVGGHLRLGFDTVLADLAAIGFDAEGALYARRRSTLPTLAAGSSSLPGLPTARDSKGAGYDGQLPNAVSLLPTPRTSDTNGPGLHGDGGMDLRTTVSLLPTPVVADSTNTANFRPDGTAYSGGYGMTLLDAARLLLPTPTATAYGNNQSDSPGAAVRPSLNSLAPKLTSRIGDGSNPPFAAGSTPPDDVPPGQLTIKID
jgi:hypothetical protein